MGRSQYIGSFVMLHPSFERNYASEFIFDYTSYLPVICGACLTHARTNSSSQLDVLDTQRLLETGYN